MISRRQMLLRGGGLTAAGLGWTAEPVAAARPGAALALFLFDASIDGISQAAARVRGHGVPVRSFSGDIGGPWADAIQPMWRRGPRPIAGITDGGALFCLDQLARSHGIACPFRLPIVTPGAARLGDAVGALLKAARTATAARPASGEPIAAQVAWLLMPVGGSGR